MLFKRELKIVLGMPFFGTILEIVYIFWKKFVFYKINTVAAVAAVKLGLRQFFKPNKWVATDFAAAAAEPELAGMRHSARFEDH